MREIVGLYRLRAWVLGLVLLLPMAVWGRPLNQPGIWTVGELVGQLSEGREVELRAGASLAGKSLFVFYREEESVLADLLEVLGARVERVHYDGVPVDLVVPVEKAGGPRDNKLFLALNDKAKELALLAESEFESLKSDPPQDPEGLLTTASNDYLLARKRLVGQESQLEMIRSVDLAQVRWNAALYAKGRIDLLGLVARHISKAGIPVPGESATFEVDDDHVVNVFTELSFTTQIGSAFIEARIIEKNSREVVQHWSWSCQLFFPEGFAENVDRLRNLHLLNEGDLRWLKSPPELQSYSAGNGGFRYPDEENWLFDYLLQDEIVDPRENMLFIVRPAYAERYELTPLTWAWPNSEFFAKRTEAGTLVIDSIYRSLDVFHPNYDYKLCLDILKGTDPSEPFDDRFLNGLQQRILDKRRPLSLSQFLSVAPNASLPYVPGDFLPETGSILSPVYCLTGCFLSLNPEEVAGGTEVSFGELSEMQFESIFEIASRYMIASPYHGDGQDITLRKQLENTKMVFVESDGEIQITLEPVEKEKDYVYGYYLTVRRLEN